MNAQTKQEPASEKIGQQDKNEKGGVGETRLRIVYLVIKILFLVALCFIVLFVVFGVTRMNDYSMYPSIKDGDLLVYYRVDSDFSNGDVIVAERDGREMVFRIIASPGQSVDIDPDNGNLTIDNQPSTYEAFYETKRAEGAMFKYPYRVSPNCYFALNDYRSNTNDSRIYGEICKNNIKGRLITKIQVREF